MAKTKKKVCGVYFVMRCSRPVGHAGRCNFVGPARHPGDFVRVVAEKKRKR